MSQPTHRARALLAQALMTDPQRLPEQPVLGATDGWDSLAHLRLVLDIEQRLGRTLDALEIVGLASLADIERLLAPVGD